MGTQKETPSLTVPATYDNSDDGVPDEPDYLHDAPDSDEPDDWGADWDDAESDPPAFGAESRDQFHRAYGYFHDLTLDAPIDDPTALAAWERIAPRYTGQGTHPQPLWDAMYAWFAYWQDAEIDRPTFAAWLADGLDREPPVPAIEGAA